MNIPIYIAAALAGAIAAPALGAAASNPVVQCADAASSVIVGSGDNVESFYGVPISLTVSDLKRLPYRWKIGQEMGEGELNTFYMITAKQGVEVKVVFHDSGNLFLAQSESSNAIGPKGVGVGSSLSDVKSAWPMGRLLYGSEDGRFVTFDTGTNVLYNFDPTEMPPEAFDRPAKDIVVPNLRVKGLRIFAR